MLVTPCRTAVARVVAGSKRSASTRGRAGGRDHPEPGVEPVDVEQRQHEEHDVVGLHRRGLEAPALREVGQHRAVAEHRAARAPARAGGEHQHGEPLAPAARVLGTGRPAGGDDRVEPGRVDVHP